MKEKNNGTDWSPNRISGDDVSNHKKAKFMKYSTSDNSPTSVNDTTVSSLMFLVSVNLQEQEMLKKKRGRE